MMSNNPSFTGRGFKFIISESLSSLPKANAGNESDIRFTQRICIALNGLGNPMHAAKNIVITSPKLLDRRKKIAFFNI